MQQPLASQLCDQRESKRFGRLERSCALFCLRPPKLLRDLTESAAKMPGQMRLIGKTGFRCDIRDRAHFGCRSQLLAIPQSTTHKLLVRRKPDYLEESAEMEQAKASRMRHFVVGQLWAKFASINAIACRIERYIVQAARDSKDESPNVQGAGSSLYYGCSPDASVCVGCGDRYVNREHRRRRRCARTDWQGSECHHSSPQTSSRAAAASAVTLTIVPAACCPSPAAVVDR